MAKLSDLKLTYRIFMEAYRYRRFDWRPGSVLRKPLWESQIAVVTSAAFFRPDQAPFDRSVRGGDVSFREIPADTNLATLRIAHKSDAFDHSGIESDKNLALPLDRLRELKAEGRIGGVAPRHYSFMGSISAPARFVRITAPAIAGKLKEDRTDAVLLTPV
jgi:D-proline reductase (dithiol) PrdB